MMARAMSSIMPRLATSLVRSMGPTTLITLKVSISQMRNTVPMTHMKPGANPTKSPIVKLSLLGQTLSPQKKPTLRQKSTIAVIPKEAFENLNVDLKKELPELNPKLFKKRLNNSVITNLQVNIVNWMYDFCADQFGELFRPNSFYRFIIRKCFLGLFKTDFQDILSKSFYIYFIGPGPIAGLTGTNTAIIAFHDTALTTLVNLLVISILVLIFATLKNKFEQTEDIEKIKSGIQTKIVGIDPKQIKEVENFLNHIQIELEKIKKDDLTPEQTEDLENFKGEVKTMIANIKNALQNNDELIEALNEQDNIENMIQFIDLK